MPVRRSSGDVIPEDEILSRVFDAPRSLVFEVWTHAEHFTQWFGPHGAEVFACEIDARPGGVIRFGHRFADGTALRVKGTFVEVVRDERLVFTFGFVDQHGHPVGHPMFPDWPLDASIEMIVTLEDVGDGTRVSVAHGVLPPAAASLPGPKRWSLMALEGSRQVLERLGQYLSLAAARTARKEHTT
jgi:uncharacterized protein YndB with AHSA1/START domain